MVHWPPLYGERVPLWDAVYTQDIIAVQKLLASPSSVEQSALAKNLILNAAYLTCWGVISCCDKRVWQQTSVHLVVSKGNSKILKTLLFAANVNVNARTINGTTPLHLALERDRKDMVQDLLLVGANPLLINVRARAPLVDTLSGNHTRYSPQEFFGVKQHTGKNAIAMAKAKGLADVSSMLHQYAENQPFQEALKAQQQQQLQKTKT